VKESELRIWGSGSVSYIHPYFFVCAAYIHIHTSLKKMLYVLHTDVCMYRGSHTYICMWEMYVKEMYVCGKMYVGKCMYVKYVCGKMYVCKKCMCGENVRM